MIELPFSDRLDAGNALAKVLTGRALNLTENTIVLALPRGGVITGAAIANSLLLPLDVVVVRKLGVPWHPELAFGAIAGGRIRVIDEQLVEELGISRAEVDAVVAREMKEVERRERLYRSERPAPDLHNWTVILADDGLATGSTMLAALEYVNSFHPAAVIVAAPVASSGAIERIRQFATDCICVAIPEPFDSVGKWYQDFREVSDYEVRVLLQQNHRRVGPPIRTVRLTPEMARRV
jgi:predicted phosphoribosyltransferase